jgi:hypothetical protein
VTRFLALDKCLPNRDFLQVRLLANLVERDRLTDRCWTFAKNSHSTAIVGGDPKPWRRPASLGLVMVPKGPSNVP